MRGFLRIEPRLDQRLHVPRVGELEAARCQTPFKLATLELKLLSRRDGPGETKLKLFGCDQPSQAENVGCQVG